MKDFLLIHILELEQEAKINRYYRRKHLKKAKEARHDYRMARADWHHRNAKGMHEHNQLVVRNAARTAQLAYAFLKGRAYDQVEIKARSMPDWKKIRIFAMRFYDVTKWPDPSEVSFLLNQWVLCGMLWYKEHNMRGRLTQQELLDILAYLRENNMEQHSRQFLLVTKKLEEATNAA